MSGGMKDGGMSRGMKEGWRNETAPGNSGSYLNLEREKEGGNV